MNKCLNPFPSVEWQGSRPLLLSPRAGWSSWTSCDPATSRKTAGTRTLNMVTNLRLNKGVLAVPLPCTHYTS